MPGPLTGSVGTGEIWADCIQLSVANGQAALDARDQTNSSRSWRRAYNAVRAQSTWKGITSCIFFDVVLCCCLRHGLSRVQEEAHDTSPSQQSDTKQDYGGCRDTCLREHTLLFGDREETILLQPAKEELSKVPTGTVVRATAGVTPV